jgi:hypothetical protein
MKQSSHSIVLDTSQCTVLMFKLGKLASTKHEGASFSLEQQH